MMELLALARAAFHDNVVQLRGVCVEPGHELLLMEHAERGSVHDVLRDDPPLWRRFGLLRDAERALRHLHTFRPGRPMVHRDIKPMNLLVFGDWTCKVADFGLARGVASSYSTAMNGMTRVYAAPEVLNNEPATTASDVYSYGMTAWEVVTGERPWREMNGPMPIMLAVAQGRRPAIPAGCDAHFAALLPLCWAQEPAQRPDFERICALSDAAAPRFDAMRAADGGGDEVERLRAEVARLRAAGGR